MQNPFSYEGKRCLFTGCFSGMGEAAARIVESLGGTILAADIKQPTSFGYERYLEVDLRDAAAGMMTGQLGMDFSLIGKD